MNKVLISFIGNNDCFLSENRNGAIISILHQLSFDKLYILYNHSRYLHYASEILLYCRKHFPKMSVSYESAITLDPTDHNLVYPAMFKAIDHIMNEEKDSEITVSITSGTPTMHACWLLLKQGGVLPGKLIQISREKGLSEVTFSLNDFPQIKSEKAIKADLTRVSRENAYLKEKLNLVFDEIIGEHSSILKVKEQISKFCRTDMPVYIAGESGTGKELVARAIHYNSKRKEAPFIAVNCGAISETLFQSEFFGHKKGAFTGAIDDHNGYFRDADQGTLFLDEIAELSLSMQTKLLRVLENNEVQTLGGKKYIVNTRIICASHQDIQEMLVKGSFRKDLYYRIFQCLIQLPPLRDRGTDILLIAQKFLAQQNKNENIHKILDKSAEKKLLSYNWPGNIRELKNVISYAWINTNTDRISAEDIVFHSQIASRNTIHIPDEGINLKQVVYDYYEAAVQKCQGNKAQAARLLNMEAHTFRKSYQNYLNSKNNALKK